jgi:hypothetical protein
LIHTRVILDSCTVFFEEVREIKRKLIIVTVLALSLVMIIAVAALAPTVAVARKKNDDDSLTYYANGGQVTVQLPDGEPSHPTSLIFASMHIERRGDYPIRGPHDVFAVYIWVPALNSFLPVAVFSDNPDPAHHDLMKEIYIGTPFWIPGVMENYFVPAEDELVTWSRGDMSFVNLTVGAHVSLNFTGSPNPQMSALGDLSFDLPPIAMEIRGFDSTYREDSEGALPSGYTSSAHYLRKPAWVRLWIQNWTGGSDAFKFAGVRGLYGKVTAIPPPA